MTKARDDFLRPPDYYCQTEIYSNIIQPTASALSDTGEYFTCKKQHPLRVLDPLCRAPHYQRCSTPTQIEGKSSCRLRVICYYSRPKMKLQWPLIFNPARWILSCLIQLTASLIRELYFFRQRLSFVAGGSLIYTDKVTEILSSKWVDKRSDFNTFLTIAIAICV